MSPILRSLCQNQAQGHLGGKILSTGEFLGKDLRIQLTRNLGNWLWL
jgi:hypothetical protein